TDISYVGVSEGEIVFIIDPLQWRNFFKEKSRAGFPEESVLMKNIDPKDKSIFVERAIQLSKPLVIKTKKELIQLIVVQYRNEFFGIDLEWINEVCDSVKYTPISLATPYFFGFMNLRGNVISLIDIWKILGIPGELHNNLRAVIINFQHFHAGIVVDEIEGIF